MEHDYRREEYRRRLPTLLEVLNRRTLAPVDLFSFYIYMRDQQCSVDYLDFWLDVSQHMSLCRHYVRELRRSVLIDTPEPEKTGGRQSSDSRGNGNGNGRGGPSEYIRNGDSQDPQRLSAFLRSEGRSSLGSRDSNPRNSDAGPRPAVLPRRMRNGSHNVSPGQQVARSDIRDSAVRILYTYLLPGSEREVILPDTIVNQVICMIEDDGRDDPEVFDTAKDYVFQAMERDAFPGFLQAKALGNMVPPSILAHLVLGLVSLGAGFWAAFYVVLTDQPRLVRCWVILPFIFGAYFLSAYQYKIDPLIALAGFSEYTFMNWTKIREPYVRSLLSKRALVALLLAVFIAGALSVLFIFVPGHRL